MKSKLFFFQTVFFLIIFIVTVWFSYFEYYTVSLPSEISDNELPEIHDRLKSYPEKHKLQRLFDVDPISSTLERYGVLDKYDIEHVIESGISLPGVSGTVKLIPFNSYSLDISNSSWQLDVNGFAVPNHLIEMYKKYNDVRYLSLSERYINSFFEYEVTNRFKSGFIFNDHAVAARVVVLVKFWLEYRDSAIYTDEGASKIISYAGFLGNRLKKESFYTYKTNHGTMENIALMLLSAVFAINIEFEEYGNIGLNRLLEQLSYLVSQEGFFLEHSFGYHHFFIGLLEMAFVIGDVDSSLSSSKVKDAYDKAVDLMFAVAKEGGQLPIMGDTSFNKKYMKQNSVEKGNQTEIKLYPQSGFAYSKRKSGTSCNNDLSTLAFYWSNFENHGHKKSNDLGVDIYTCGTQLWRESGYFPYWHRFRKDSEGWLGSNAPHLVNESAPRSNSITSVGFIDESDLHYLTATRSLSETLRIQREVIIFSTTTYVIDSFIGEVSGEVDINWTMNNQVKLVGKPSEYSYLFQDSKNGRFFFTEFLSNVPFSVSHSKSDSHSIIGWQEVKGEIVPADSMIIRTESVANESLLNVTSMLSDGACIPETSFKTENHSIRVVSKGCGMDRIIERTKGGIVVTDNGNTLKSMVTYLDESYIVAVNNVNNATKAIFEKYGDRFNPWYEYRVKVTFLGICLFTLLIALYLLLIRWFKLSVSSYLSGFACVAWLALILWTQFVYLV